MNHKRLICFTYAGGTKAFFDEIEKDLDGIDLIKLEYAGRGERYKEEFYKSFTELADDLFSQIKDILICDYALFGYSMGTISLVEVLKRIIESNLKLPSHLFIAAHEPHTKVELCGFKPDEEDDWVKERTIQFGAVPEKLQNNRVFWRSYLPIYRADYSIIGAYDFNKLNLKTGIPADIFYSESDTPISEMKLWEKYFPCEYHSYEGTHFFIREHHSDMARIIRNKMEIR